MKIPSVEDVHLNPDRHRVLGYPVLRMEEVMSIYENGCGDFILRQMNNVTGF